MELIVETSVRLADQDGDTVQVIDEQGRLRSGMTIADVLQELRAKHPTLFKAHPDEKAAPDSMRAAPAGDAKPGITVADAPSAQEPAAQEPAEPEPPPRRDWLIIGEGAPAASARRETARHETDRHETALPAAPKIDWQERREALTRVTGGLGSRLRGVATSLTSHLRGARGSMAHSFDDVQTEIFRDRSPRLSRGHLMGAAAGVLALALVAYFVYAIASLPFGSGLGGRNRIAAAPAPTSEPVDTGSVSAGSTATATAPPAVPNGPLKGVPEVLDTATLWLQGKIVHLYGVEWVRGGGDPEEFTRYLRGREVTCDPVENVDAYRCKTDGRDLSEVVLFNGGGKTTPNAPPEFRAAEEKARAAKLGVWSKT